MVLDWLDTGDDDADAARACLRHGLAALNYLHAHGVLHRDVKPANLLFHRRTSCWKLLDLDCAVLAEGGLSVAVCEGRLPIGTEGFLAPELLLPNGRYTAASDIWALGMTLRRKFRVLPDDVEVAVQRMIATRRVEPTVEGVGRHEIQLTATSKSFTTSQPRHPLQEINPNAQ